MRYALIPCLAALTACGSGASNPPPPPSTSQNEGWDKEWKLDEPADLSPDPKVLEVSIVAKVTNLEIMAGKQTPAWTYGDRIPGPLLHAKKGDRLIVHFTNQLPEPSTIHWHGIRGSNAMDGVPVHSQPEVPIGGSFTYDLPLNDAGLFWYHPHVSSAEQVGNGLYGAILVDDPDEPKDLGDEVVLVLSDLSLGDDGQLSPKDAGGDLATLFGREGQYVLANGKQLPTLRPRPASRIRLRVVNAAKSRYFQLALEGHHFLQIGSDGGLMEEPIDQERPVLAPGERADLILTMDAVAGIDRVLRWIPFDRGYGSTEFRDEVPIAHILTEGEPLIPNALPSIVRPIAPLPTTDAELIDLELTQSTTATPLLLGINGVPSWRAAPVPATIGGTQVFTIKNTMDWGHPFHLHGFFFQVLDENGQPTHPLAWKDTVRVPVMGTVKIVVRYDDRPGMWMFHCHILDHADAGMMGMISLGPGHH